MILITVGHFRVVKYPGYRVFSVDPTNICTRCFPIAFVLEKMLMILCALL